MDFYADDEYRAPYHRRRSFSFSDLKPSATAPWSINFVFLFTILLIVIYQFRGHIVLWLDRIRIGNQSILEMLISIGQSISAFVWVPDGDDDNDAAAATGGRARKRKKKPPSNMPELEFNECSSNNNKQTLSRKRNGDYQEIAPAFEDEKQYPSGWLVYHSKLGIVPKKEADEYCAMHDISKRLE